MKVVNKICRFAAIVFGVGALVLFFTRFAAIVSGENTVNLVGAQLAFGSKIKVAGAEVDMARSSDILFCFWLTVIATLMSAFSFKAKGLRYAAPAVGLVSGIYMLVIALSNPWKFVDTRPLPDVTSVKYSSFVLLTAVAILVFAVLAIAYLLIDDHIEAKASGKLTIPKRIVRFFRDYKSEIKKIVWPGFKEVLKNTGIVLVMCIIVGAFIWLVDYGLGKLLTLILGA